MRRRGKEKKKVQARTWVDPLHAIWITETFIRQTGVRMDAESVCGGDSTAVPQIIRPPSGIGNDGVSGGPGREGDEEAKDVEY